MSIFFSCKSSHLLEISVHRKQISHCFLRWSVSVSKHVQENTIILQTLSAHSYGAYNVISMLMLNNFQISAKDWGLVFWK